MQRQNTSKEERERERERGKKEEKAGYDIVQSSLRSTPPPQFNLWHSVVFEKPFRISDIVQATHLGIDQHIFS